MQKWTQLDLQFQIDLRTIKKAVNMIETHGKNWYKMLENGQRTDFVETFYQM